MGVNVRPGVLCLASLFVIPREQTTPGTKSEWNTYLKQDIWHNVVYLSHELEEFVVWHVLECKLALRDIARIRLAKHRMTITRNNLTALQCRPNVLLDCFVTGIFTNLPLHFCEPDEYFLVREAVQRTSETIQRRCVRKERIRERGTDELSGVC